MIEAYKSYWKGYADFTGRTSVGGYWWAVLAHVLATFLLSFLVGLAGGLGNNQHVVVTFSATLMLLCITPSLAIAVRRLRDAGHAWTNLFWAFLPLVGPIMLIVMLCKPTDSVASHQVIEQGSSNGSPSYRAYAPQQAVLPMGGMQTAQAYAPSAAAAAAPSAQPMQPVGAFRKPSLHTLQPYTGPGVCDVCNRPLSGRSAYVVPNPVFYGSPEWREHFRQMHRAHHALLGLAGAGIDADADRQIEMMRRNDSSAGSAVCADCIHMFAE